MIDPVFKSMNGQEPQPAATLKGLLCVYDLLLKDRSAGLKRQDLQAALIWHFVTGTLVDVTNDDGRVVGVAMLSRASDEDVSTGEAIRPLFYDGSGKTAVVWYLYLLPRYRGVRSVRGAMEEIMEACPWAERIAYARVPLGKRSEADAAPLVHTLERKSEAA